MSSSTVTGEPLPGLYSRLPVAALSAACRAQPAPSAPVGRPDVVLVTIDTLRADHATPALMPTLAALSARGLRFTTARTVAPLTLPAHTSLMTGLYPPRHGVRLNGVRGLSPGVPTLAQAFSSAGYETAAFIGAFVLDRRFGLSESFAEYDDRIPRQKGAMDRLEAERRGSDVVDSAVRWLTQPARTRGRPLFLWVHLYDPHAPYEPPDESRRRANGDAYGGEVSYADEQVGRLIAALTSAGLSDPLIVVMGDHGESLGEHGEPGHGMLLYEGAVRIPLVIAGPGVPHGERSDPVSLVDVAPTLLARAGLPPWPDLDGRDLLAEGAAEDREVYGETEYPRTAGWSPLAMLANARWKLVDGPQPELYDSMADAHETSDRAGERPKDVAGMRQRLAPMRSARIQATQPAMPAEVERKLRALGYVAAAPSVPLPPDAPNPAAMMGDWSSFESALGATDAVRAAGVADHARTPGAGASRITAVRHDVGAGAGRGRAASRCPSGLSQCRVALAGRFRDRARSGGLRARGRSACRGACGRTESDRNRSLEPIGAQRARVVAHRQRSRDRGAGGVRTGCFDRPDQP